MPDASIFRALSGATRLPVRQAALRLSVLGLATLVACGGGQDTARAMATEEDTATTDNAPVDNGRPHALSARAAVVTAAGYIPTGNPLAGTQGVFGPVLKWPLMPIHQVLLPDGRVLFYGSDINGQQGGSLHYAVWDPSLGTGSAAFTVLPNTVGSDVFCAGQALLPDNGDVLIVGGTIAVNGVRGYGMADTNVFQSQADSLAAQNPMAYRRWYPTVLTLASGDQLVMGGRMDRDSTVGGAGVDPQAAASIVGGTSTATYATTPELWSRASGWTTLSGAMSDTVFGSTDQGWYYPRAWVMPGGNVFVLSNSGSMYMLDPTGTGALTQLPGTLQISNSRLQSVMFQPGRILTLRQKQSAAVIDINGAQPQITNVAPSTRYRQYGNATLLADGEVWMNGGSSDGNVTTGDYLVSEAWNPATQQWSDMASAAVIRLYHSTALLLPDATVVTGGGGDPGPVRNLNAEIYYPPYLYLKDGSGNPAPRPAITSAPDVLGWGQSFAVQVSSTTPVSRVTLVRTGTVTHAFNTNQRFQDMAFTQIGSTVSLTTPATADRAPPGYYMLFVFDGNGVPSVAKVFRIGA